MSTDDHDRPQDKVSGTSDGASVQQGVHTDAGAYVTGNVETQDGTFVGRDQIIHGDVVGGDKVGGDKVLGNKNVYVEDVSYDVRGLTNPYPGLQAFTYAERDLFAGRTQKAAEATTKLTMPGDQQSLLFITGASGSGKSSFAQAGLIPSLEVFYEQRNFSVRKAVMRPGTKPLALLADALLQLGLPVDDTFAEVKPFMLGVPASFPPENSVGLLIIDQFEEVFSAQCDSNQSSIFLTLLAKLPPFVKLRMHLIATLRADFLPELFQHTALFDIAKQGIDLRKMTIDELKDAIQRPLQQVSPNKRFEASLLDQLAQDASASAAYLPLLQLAIGDIWRHGRLIPQYYNSLADVLRERADAVQHYVDYDGDRQQERSLEDHDAIMAIFLDLVEVSLNEDARRDVRQQRTLAELTGNNARRRQLVEDLLSARLLNATTVSSQSSTAPIDVVVDIIHESLIAHWDRLKSAIAMTRETLQRRTRFVQALREWEEHRHSDDFLLTGIWLAEAEVLHAAGDIEVQSREAQSFIDLSRSNDEREKERLREALTAAQTRAIQICVRNGTQNLKEGYLWGAWVWFSEGLRLEVYEQREVSHRIRLASIRRALPTLHRAWFHDEPARHILFSPDAKHLLTVNSEAISIWDVKTHKLIAKIVDVHPQRLTFSHDGKHILALVSSPGNYRQTIFRAWQYPTGEPDTTFEPHDSWALAFDETGRYLLASAGASHLSIWDVTDGEQPIDSWEIGASPNIAELSTDARIAMAVVGKQILIRDIQQHIDLPPLVHAADIHYAALNPGRTHVVAGVGDEALIWNLSAVDRGPLKLALGRRLEQLDFSPDRNHMLITVKLENKGFETRVWDVVTGRQDGTTIQHEEIAARWEFDLPLGARAGGGAGGAAIASGRIINPFTRYAAFSPDGRRIAAISEQKHTVRVWDWRSGEAQTPPIDHFDNLIDSASFSPDGHLLATCASDRTSRVWEVTHIEADAVPIRHNSRVDHVAFSPDGAQVAFVSYDSPPLVWNHQQHTKVLELAEGSEFIAFSLDGRYLVTGGSGARVWDARTGAPITPTLAHKLRVEGASFSNDNRLLMTRSSGYKEQGEARVWDVERGIPVTAPLVHRNQLRWAAFSPDTRFVLGVSGASYEGESEAVVWEIATGVPLFPPLHQSDRVDHALFSADGSEIWTYSGSEFRRWDAHTGASLTDAVTNKSYLRRFCACSPNGNRVLMQSRNGKQVQIIDVATGLPVSPQMDHDNSIEEALFSADGRRLLTISRNQARAWDAETAEILAPPMLHLARIGHAAFTADGTMIAIASGEASDGFAHAANAVFIWQLLMDNAPVEALVLGGQASSQHRVDSAGGFVPLEFEAFREVWERLSAQYPDALDVDDRALLWYKQQARKRGDYGQNFHLRLLEELQPDDPWPYEERARCLAEQGQHLEAAEAYSQALTRGSPTTSVLRARGEAYLQAGKWQQAADDLAKTLNTADAEAWNRYILVTILAGNEAEYRQACQRMLQQFMPNEDEPDSTDRWNKLFYLTLSCVTAPAALTDWQALERALPAYANGVREIDKRRQGNSHLLLGAVLYRAGQLASAVEHLEQSATPPHNQLFLAMAYHALGRREAATGAIETANNLMKRMSEDNERYHRQRPWFETVMIEILQREARQLLAENTIDQG